VTEVGVAEAQGTAHDASVKVLNADDIGELERALSAARARAEESLPARTLAGLEAKRAKFQALVDATDVQIAAAKAGTL
jgi:hypothetical protein